MAERPADPAGDPFLRPQWADPDAVPAGRVRALMSTRHGGAGQPPFDTCNLAADPLDPAVAENRRRFAQALGATPRWLNQVHGATVLRLGASPTTGPREADASISTVAGVGCTVFAADCLPVLFCVDGALGVGAAHAGWRGLAGGVLEATVQALCLAAGQAPRAVQAWLGPCIGPNAFEVGADVLQAFGRAPDPCDDAHFRWRPRPDGSARWHADLPGLARHRLQQAGVSRISGGQWCTVSEPSRFFSFRRDRGSPGSATGRMAAAIALLDA